MYVDLVFFVKDLVTKVPFGSSILGVRFVSVCLNDIRFRFFTVLVLFIFVGSVCP